LEEVKGEEITVHEIGPQNFPDKSKWGEGPWRNEKDLQIWKDADTGYHCRIERSPSGGYLCGYVGVAKGHPLYGRDWLSQPVRQLKVRRNGITITLKSQEPALHWFGFDCGRYGDLSPADRALGMSHTQGSEYVTWDEVKQEVLELAKQLKEHEENGVVGEDD
jgi:hypothetical protein